MEMFAAAQAAQKSTTRLAERSARFAAAQAAQKTQRPTSGA